VKQSLQGIAEFSLGQYPELYNTRDLKLRDERVCGTKCEIRSIQEQRRSDKQRVQLIRGRNLAHPGGVGS
jgi:hypothetical protein